MKPVTDPALLSELNTPVTDAALLAELNGTAPPKKKKVDPRQDPMYLQAMKELKESGGFWANLGAGMDNVVQGAKQLVGKGDDDETIMERRRIKDELADGMTGGGLVQFGGEMLAGAPIGGGVGSVVGKVATKALPKVAALATRAGNRVMNAGTVGRAGVEGAVGGALAETTSDESRGANMVAGTVLSAAPTVAMAGAGRLRKAVGSKYAKERAGRVFEKQLGKDNLTQISDALHDPLNTPTLPLSTAGKTQNVALASLERGARSRGDWAFEHDRKVAEQAWDMLKGATKDADDLDVRIADREAVIKAGKENLANVSTPAQVADANNFLGNEIERLRQTPAARQNPELTNELGKVEQMLSHPDATAQDFASQYFRLTEAINTTKLPTEAANQLRALRDLVAQGADIASGDKHFSDLLGRYMGDEASVAQAGAAKGIREAFVSPQGVVSDGRKWGNTPEVTERKLRKTLASVGEGPFGDVVGPGVRQDVSNLADELSRHELWKPANSSGTTTLNMPNPLSVVSSGRDNPFNFLPLVKGGANWFMSGSRNATTNAADEALANPQKWQEMMDALAKDRSPLKDEELKARILRQILLTPGRAGTAVLGGE